MSTDANSPKVTVEFHVKGSISISPEQWADFQAEMEASPMIKDIQGSLFQAYFAHLHRYYLAQVKTGKTTKGKTANIDITLMPGKPKPQDA